MVAGEVEVRARKAGEEHGWIWRSDGRSGFTVEEAEAAPPRGTAVILQAARGCQGVPRRVPPAPDRAQLFRPHRGADPAHQGERRDAEASRARREPKEPSRSSRRARCGPGPRPRSATSSTRSSTTTSRMRSTSPGRASTSRPRAWCPTRRCCSCRGPSRSTSTTRSAGTASSSTCGACSSPTTWRALMPRYLRFVRGVDRFRGPAAQRLARDAAAQRACSRGSGRTCQAPARRARAPRQGRGRRLRDVLGAVRRGAQGGPLRGPRAARPPARSSRASAAPPATAGSGSPTTSAA